MIRAAGRNWSGGGLIGAWAVGQRFSPAGDAAKGEAADQRILGDGDFVKQVVSGLDDLVKKNLRLSGQRIDIKALARKVAERYNVSIGELRSGGRRRAVVNARACHVVDRCPGTRLFRG